MEHLKMFILVSKGVVLLNLLQTKRDLLYIRNQSVPRCKHFTPRLLKDQMQSDLYKESVRTAL